MVSSITRFIFGLSSITLLAPVSHARSFARDTTVPTDLQGTWVSLGCYVDVGRTLTDGGYDDVIGMTDESCIAYCNNAGYNYAGTEYFHECFCGDTLSVGGVPANSEDCSTPCVGDPTEPCGGPNRLNLFWNGISPPEVNPGKGGWSSIGCYSEGTTGRALEYQYIPPDGTEMTVDICTSACHNNAYTFAGLEYADECWCGSDIENGGALVLDGTGCEMICPGNHSEYCGGPSLLEMYQFGAPVSTTKTTSSSASIISTTSTSSSVVSTSSSIVLTTSSTSSSVQSTTPSTLSTVSSAAPTTSSTAITTFSIVPTSTSSTSSLPTSSAPSVPQTLGIKQTVGDYTYQGCYTEGDGVRALSESDYFDYVGMTLEACANACSAFTYFGVEYHGECYCGNSIDPTAGLAINQGDCNFICPGDQYEYCGAGDRLDMYKKDTTSGDSTAGTSTSSSASVASSSSVVSSSSAASSSSIDPPAPTSSSTSTSQTSSSSPSSSSTDPSSSSSVPSTTSSSSPSSSTSANPSSSSSVPTITSSSSPSSSSSSVPTTTSSSPSSSSSSTDPSSSSPPSSSSSPSSISSDPSSSSSVPTTTSSSSPSSSTSSDPSSSSSAPTVTSSSSPSSSTSADPSSSSSVPTTTSSSSPSSSSSADPSSSSTSSWSSSPSSTSGGSSPSSSSSSPSSSSSSTSSTSSSSPSTSSSAPTTSSSPSSPANSTSSSSSSDPSSTSSSLSSSPSSSTSSSSSSDPSSTSSSFSSSPSSSTSSSSSSSPSSTSSSLSSSPSSSTSSTSSSDPSSTSSSFITTSSSSPSSSSTSTSLPSSSCSSGPRPSNIIPDPSFEDTTSTAWHFIDSSVTSSESISGLYSGELTGNSGEYSLIYDFIPYTAYWGETLYLSYAAKFTGDSAALCYFQALTGSSTIQEVDNLETSDWQYYTATYVVPGGDETEGFAFALICSDPDALLYIDDIYFGPAASAPGACTSATSSSSSSAPSSTSSSSAPSSTSSSDPSSTSSSSSPSSTSSSDPSSTSSSSSTPSSTSSSAPSSTSSSSSSSSLTTTSTTYTGTPTPSIVPSALNGYCVFIGCYTEATNSRALDSDQFYNYNVGTGMTVEKCAAYCGNDYDLFGVEYSGECYCGNTLQSGSVVRPPTECYMTCDGAPLEFCGGPNRLNVYSCGATTSSSSSIVPGTTSTSASVTTSTSAPATTTTAYTGPPTPSIVQTAPGYNYIGCYTEATNSRALISASYVNYNSLTVEICASFCGPTYSLFGVEWSGECYCGNVLQQGSAKVDDSQCNSLCDGNHLEYCGGGDRLNLYSAIAGTSTTSTSTTATSSTTSPTSNSNSAFPNVGSYSYYGCQTEGSNTRALNAKTTAYDSMTLQSCANDCAEYTYFGTEYGRECYCGNSFSTGSQSAPQDECTFPCAGNGAEICGAGLRLSVYSTSTPVAVVTISNPATVGNYDYYGCMTEGTNSRALQGYSTAYDTMTLASCAQDCAGFEYFGTEYARECYCGNSFSAGAVSAPEAECQNTDFLCMGDNEEFCGGSRLLSVYKLA